jgi:hypothetical protein
MAQAVSRRSLAAEARVCARNIPYGICGGQSDIGTEFYTRSSGFACLYNSTVFLYSHISSGG